MVIQKLTRFGSILMLRYLKHVYFHFTRHTKKEPTPTLKIIIEFPMRQPLNEFRELSKISMVMGPSLTIV
jgi:hypothetical protein